MADTLIKKSMRLFGLPYQFTSAVDPRLDEISNTVGNKFLNNILLEGPVCTIIPGEPYYLPGVKSKDRKVSLTSLLLEKNSMSNTGFSNIINNLSDDDDNFRLYDFKRNYTEFMKYVNILCRTGAIFLGLGDVTLDGVELSKYDWRTYKQNAEIKATYIESSSNALSKAAKKQSGYRKIERKATKSGTMVYETGNTTLDESDDTSFMDLFRNQNYLQFFVDPDVSCSENLGNSTSESMMKSMFDSGSNLLKEIAFMTNSASPDLAASMQEFANGTIDSLNSGIQDTLGNVTLTSGLSRIINLGTNVIKGENIVIPDIYQSSNYSKSYSITVHLKSPYGTKLGYYLDIFVPMMHLIALGLPKQTTANSYASPFLVKAYVEGIFNCNMGMVTSVSITKAGENWTVEGLPNEVDVTLDIADLYTSLTMTPQSSPAMFINNSSLIEYIAINCGLSITAPNLSIKYETLIGTFTNAVTSVPSDLYSTIQEKLNELYVKFTGLEW